MGEALRLKTLCGQLQLSHDIVKPDRPLFERGRLRRMICCKIRDQEHGCQPRVGGLPWLKTLFGQLLSSHDIVKPKEEDPLQKVD